MISTPNRFKSTALALAAATTGLAAFAATPAFADGHMEKADETPDIVATAMSTGMHKTLVAAVKAAGLVETLQSPGPFTVFAPTDDAFAKLPDGTVATLVKPENKDTLTAILTYHVVAGEVTSDDLFDMIEDGDGTATFETVAGGTLTATATDDGDIIIIDAKGGTSTVVMADVEAKNGYVHVTDGVFLPA